MNINTSSRSISFQTSDDISTAFKQALAEQTDDMDNLTTKRRIQFTVDKGTAASAESIIEHFTLGG